MTDPGSRSVAYLLTSSGSGGAEKQVHDLALAMKARGWEVLAISMLPVEFAFDGLEAAGIRVFTLGMRAGVPDPRGLWRLRTILRHHRPAVLHAHMVHANLLARLSRLLVRTPVVISTIHSQYQGARWRYMAYRITDRLSDLTTAVSQVAADDAVQAGVAAAGRILTVPNGVVIQSAVRDLATRDRLREALGLGHDFTWLTASRLTEAKDFPNMVSAFQRVLAQREATRLLIAGSGPLQEELEGLRSEPASRGRITLLGQRPDVSELMQAADGFVMSSAWEGLPVALLEAGASQLPIVATNAGGTRDTVVEGVSGYVVPTRDPRALADAMLHVMALSPGERAAMGKAGLQHAAATFDLDRVAARWDAIYRDLLARHHVTAP